MKRILLVLIVLIVLLQGIQFEKTNPSVISDFSESAEVKTILKRSCYDCHSNETKWPYYSYLFPISYLLAKHVEEGRDELNFSEWGELSVKKQKRKAGEILEEIEEGEMPPWDYKLLHPDSKISEEDLNVLKAWAEGKESK